MLGKKHVGIRELNILVQFCINVIAFFITATAIISFPSNLLEFLKKILSPQTQGENPFEITDQNPEQQGEGEGEDDKADEPAEEEEEEAEAEEEEAEPEEQTDFTLDQTEDN